MASFIRKQILILSVAVLIQNAFAQMGPLHLDLLNAGACEGKETEIIEMDVKSLSENQKAIAAKFNLPFPLDQLVSYTIRVDKIDDGKVQEGIFRHGGPYFCTDIEKFFGKIWTDLAASMGMPEGCPKPKGNYAVDSYPINYDDVKMDSFLYGRFKANIDFKRMGKDVACFFFEFTNTPPGESVK